MYRIRYIFMCVLFNCSYFSPCSEANQSLHRGRAGYYSLRKVETYMYMYVYVYCEPGSTFISNAFGKEFVSFRNCCGICTEMQSS